MPKLSEVEILDKMSDAQGWERHGDMLVKTWRFSSFRRAIEFVNLAAEMMIKQDHHPTLVVSYRDVRVETCTGDEGGLTEKDFELIRALETIPVDR